MCYSSFKHMGLSCIPTKMLTFYLLSSVIFGSYFNAGWFQPYFSGFYHSIVSNRMSHNSRWYMLKNGMNSLHTKVKLKRTLCSYLWDKLHINILIHCYWYIWSFVCFFAFYENADLYVFQTLKTYLITQGHWYMLLYHYVTIKCISVLYFTMLLWQTM